MRFRLLVLIVSLLSGAAMAQTAPVHLGRGINITGWFRFPVSRDPAVLANYVSDQGLSDLHTAGFDFVRLPVDPDSVDIPTLIAAIRRIQRRGFAVVISLHPQDWHLESDPGRLLRFWHVLAPALRALDPARTVPEVVNEPVFPNDPDGWARLQHRVVTEIRIALPQSTIVLTGQDWGSIAGLQALVPEKDSNVLYSFHFYDPVELTSLAAYRSDVDRGALATLPFPAGNDCAQRARRPADTATSDLIRYYCASHWDRGHLIAAIDRAARWAALYHVHLIAGEFGATERLNRPARLAWLETVRQAFEARGIGWTLWGYDDIMGLAVGRPIPRRPLLDPGVMAALGMTTGM